MGELHLLAQDEADLPALSALVQDATLRTQDIALDTRGRRLVLLVNRYRPEAEAPSRVRAALRVEHVLKVARRNWPEGETVLALLALDWVDGALLMRFSGGVALKAQCDALDVVLEDIGTPWTTDRIPKHDH
jgi:hypothetical protein